MNRKTKAGWKAFQRRRGLVADGIPGAGTLAAVVELEFWDDAETDSAYSYGGDPIKSGLFRDPTDLIPAFADRVELLFKRIRAQGFDPLLWEAYRSPERARKLAKKGTGIRMSMHCLNAAVDIVEADLTHWAVPAGFWDSISDNAEALGLVTLYRNGKHRDRPHVQALPVSMQSKFRRMTKAQQIAYVTKRLG